MIDTYDVGDKLEVTGTYVNAAGTAEDPATVRFEVKDPNGDITAYTYGADVEVVKQSTGVYTVNVDFTTAGLWSVRHYSESTGQSAAERSYWVKVSAFA